MRGGGYSDPVFQARSVPSSGVDSHGLSLRPYDPRDDTAVWALHRWAIQETGVDPSDIPGTDDLRTIATSYLETGGAFVVGIVDTDHPRTDQTENFDASPQQVAKLTTHDGILVAMGGFIPTEVGRSDERNRPGAAELHRMRVAPTHQRRGYGRQLLNELERRAAGGGYETLLATTSTRQTAALEFYHDQGYDQTATSTAGTYELVHFEKEL